MARSSCWRTVCENSVHVCAAVVGHEGTARADDGVDAARVTRVKLDGVDARVAAAGAGPVGTGGVPVQCIDGRPRVAPIFGAKEAGRLRAGEDDAGLARVAGRDVPDVADGDAHVLRETEPLAAVIPRLAQVGALRDRGPPRPVVRRRVQPRRAASRVGRHVVHGPAGVDGSGEPPRPACCVRRVDERALLRADEQAYFGRHQSASCV